MQGLGNGGPFAGLAGMAGGDLGGAAADVGSEVEASDLLLPGLDEALAFDELLKHIEDLRWDVVVFDTAPTGHTLRFLALPELIDAWSDRLLRLMRASGGIRSMLFGRKESDAMKDELERFRRRVLHIRRILSDPSTTRFTLVTIPERMGVNETVRANEALQHHGLPVTGCVVNRVTPEFDHPFLARRRSEEQGRIRELEEALGDFTPVCVPLMDTEVHGLEGFVTSHRSSTATFRPCLRASVRIRWAIHCTTNCTARLWWTRPMTRKPSNFTCQASPEKTSASAARKDGCWSA